MKSISQKIRDQVRAKFDARCAFCGSDVSEAMHIWDIQPIQMAITESGTMVWLNTNLSNLLPCCKSCDSTRRRGYVPMTIEEFRQEIQRQFEFLRSGGITRNSYGKSIRFGLIRETGVKVTFLFEQINENAS